MPRYAPKMTPADLLSLVFTMAKENDYVEDYGPIDETNPDLERLVMMLLSEELLPAVETDWNKVDFSWENLSVNGVKTTQDGIPFIDMLVGGDWETPLMAIIYHDGKKFRGYIPKKGNAYNHKAKSAFGNNDNDAAEAKKQFGPQAAGDDDYIDVSPDATMTLAEIENRLEAKGTYTVSQKSVVSKAAQKAKAQAEIEKTQDLSGPITADMVYAVINLAAGGSYVEFELRSSRRQLKPDEANRLVGVPAVLEKRQMRGDDGNILWYSPMNCYPIATQKLLEAAGFEKAPDNDLTPYEGARTVYITL